MLDFLTNALVAGAVGGLLGLERENAHPEGKIGLRTLSLISFLGFLLSTIDASFVFAALGFIAVSAFAAIYEFYAYKRTHLRGITTVSIVPLCFLLGVLVSTGRIFEAVFSSVLVAILLAEKAEVHSLVERFTKEEVVDILRFIIIAFLAYQFIPPQGVNFFGINLDLAFYWSVVTVVALTSFVAHMLTKFLRQRGFVLSAFLGGMISSLATLALLARSPGKKGSKEFGAAYFFSGAGAGVAEALLLALVVPAFFLKVFPLFLAFFASNIAMALAYYRDAKFEFKQRPISFSFVLEFAALFLIASVVLEALVHTSAFGLVASAALLGALNSLVVVSNLGLLFANGDLALSQAFAAALVALVASKVAKIAFVVIECKDKELRKHMLGSFIVSVALALAFYLWW